MYGISKDTLHRLLKKGMITGVNLGVRLTGLRWVDLEVLFTAVELPIEKETEPEKLDYAIGDCYTLSEVSSKFNANPSTVSSVIRKFSIPKKQVGN